MIVEVSDVRYRTHHFKNVSFSLPDNVLDGDADETETKITRQLKRVMDLAIDGGFLDEPISSADHDWEERTVEIRF